MKRISILFSCLLLAVTASASAQTDLNKTATGRVISSSAFALVIQTDADVRLNLVLNSTTSKPAILTEGETVSVVYRPLDAGGFEALQVLAGTEATEPVKAGGSSTRTLTNVGAPGTGGQTGESRTTNVGTTGGFKTPGNPAQPSKMATTEDNMAETHPMTVATPDTMNDDQMAADKMAADKVAADQMAADKVTADKLAADKVTADQMAADKLAADNSANATTDDTLPRTASPEPAILLIGLFALAGAMFVYRRRITL